MSNEKFDNLRKELSKVRDEIAESEFYDDPCSVLEKFLDKEAKLVSSLNLISPDWEEKEKLELEKLLENVEKKKNVE